MLEKLTLLAGVSKLRKNTDRNTLPMVNGKNDGPSGLTLHNIYLPSFHGQSHTSIAFINHFEGSGN